MSYLCLTVRFAEAALTCVSERVCAPPLPRWPRVVRVSFLLLFSLRSPQRAHRHVKRLCLKKKQKRKYLFKGLENMWTEINRMVRRVCVGVTHSSSMDRFFLLLHVVERSLQFSFSQSTLHHYPTHTHANIFLPVKKPPQNIAEQWHMIRLTCWLAKEEFLRCNPLQT